MRLDRRGTLCKRQVANPLNARSMPSIRAPRDSTWPARLLRISMVTKRGAVTKRVRAVPGTARTPPISYPTPGQFFQHGQDRLVTCADALVTADNRALNELGPIGSAHLMRASPSTGREDDGSGLDGIQRLQAHRNGDRSGRVGRGTKRRRDPRGTWVTAV